MFFSEEDWISILLTLKLAFTTTLILLCVSTPLAWWLARSRSWLSAPVSALVSMPLILPPTVLGFYLLLAMGPEGPIGAMTKKLGIGLLPFTFWGIVIGSIFYSLPFVVQPIQNAFELMGRRPIEVAASLRAGPLDRFFSVALPLARPGIFSGAILGFAHTVGEFGVVLMIGGNIPGATRVVSVQIYDHVETMEYARAQALSLAMVLFSFLALVLLAAFNRGKSRGRGPFGLEM